MQAKRSLRTGSLNVDNLFREVRKMVRPGTIQMLHYRTVYSETLELLKMLMQNPRLHQLYLVGGTALALQTGALKKTFTIVANY